MQLVKDKLVLHKWNEGLGGITMRRKNIEPIKKNLEGQTIVFTGGTDGMGRVAVERLAEMNADLIILGRNEEKSLGVVKELKKILKTGKATYVHCDLASLQSVRTAAYEILELCPKIDVLVNCAGIQPGTVRKESADGYELNWAVNHLGSFLLNNLLLDRLKESAPSRIVNLSSATERSGHIQLEDIQLKENFSVMKAYPQAKLAMNMCTRKMAKELEGTGVTVNALNPGHIKTNLERYLKGWTAIVGKTYTYLCGSEPEVGAERILRLAISDDYKDVSGKFIYEDRVKDPNPEALDDKLVEKVWEISREHVGIIDEYSR